MTNPNAPKGHAENDLQIPGGSIWYECDTGKTCTLIQYFKNVSDGEKEWREKHREDGPANITNTFIRGIEPVRHWSWYKNDMLHREDGPAVVIDNDLGEEWFIRNEQITSDVEEWIKRNRLPSWGTWTHQEKTLYKMKFL